MSLITVTVLLSAALVAVLFPLVARLERKAIEGDVAAEVRRLNLEHDERMSVIRYRKAKKRAARRLDRLGLPWN